LTPISHFNLTYFSPLRCSFLCLY